MNIVTLLRVVSTQVKNIDIVVLYRHAKTYYDIFTRFGDIDFFPLLHTSETTVHRIERQIQCIFYV